MIEFKRGHVTALLFNVACYLTIIGGLAYVVLEGFL
jgi:hypothetical protein